MVHEDGRADGFSVELLRAALKAMGREVTFRPGAWADVKGWLERGEVQVLPLAGRTPEREAVFDFTVPYLTMHGAIVVRQETKGIADLNDLRGRRVAVMRGDNTEEFLRREDRGIDIMATRTFTDALHALSAGRCDAVIVQRLVASRLLAEHRLTNLRVVDRPIEGFSQDFCFAVREGDRETLALLNEGLALVVADGTHRRLHVKWFASLELPSNRPIVIGGDHNFPPFEYLDEKGRPAGFTVEMTQAIAREMGIDVRIHLGPWTEIMSGLENGDIDAVQGHFHTDEREKHLDFTPPYATASYVSVVRRGQGQPPETVAELTNRNLVVQDGDVIVELVDRHELRNRTTMAATQEDALRAVAEGRQDCALALRPGALHLIQQNGWTNLVLGTHSFFSGQYCYAVKKDRTALLAELSEGMQVLKHSGQYRAIYEKWLGLYEPDRPAWRVVLKYVAMVGVPLMAIALLMLAWSWSLRHQVAERTAELASQYRLLEVAGETARFGGWSTDLAANKITWSDLAAEIHDMPRGYSPTVEEGLGFYAPEWRETIKQVFSTCARDGTPYDKEVEVVTAQGRRVWVRTTGEAVRDASGKIIRVQGAFQDITEHKHAVAALAEEALRRRILIEESRDGIVVLDQEGKVFEANRRFAEMLGYSLEETRRLHVWDWDLRWTPEQLLEMVRAAGSEGDHFETRHRRSDGSTFDVEISNNGAMLSGRKLIFCVCRDITARKRAEAALAASERKWRDVLVNVPQIGIALDANGRVAFLNDYFLRLTGWKAEEVLGRDWFDGFVPPETRENVRRVFFDVMTSKNTGAFHTFENEIITRTGERRRVAWSNVLTRDFNGDAIDMTCLGVDLTERLQAEASLRQSEEQFRTLVEQSPAAIFIQTHARFAYVNPAALRLFGCDQPNELLGQPVLDRFHPDHRETVRERVRRLNEYREAAPPLEETCLRRDGTHVSVEASAVPFTYQGASGALVFAHDITERKRAEEQVRAAHLETARLLTQTQKARQALLSVVEDQREAEAALQQSVERLGVLSAVAARLLTVEDRQTGIHEVCDRVMRHLGCEAFFNFLADEPARQLWLNTCEGLPEPELSRIRLLDYGVAVCGCVARDRQRIVVEDVQHSVDTRTRLIKSYGLQAYCCHPLLAQGRLIGTLSFGTTTRPNFNADEIELMRAVADQVAIALLRIQAEQALRQSEEQFRAMFEVASIGMAQADLKTGQWLRVNRKLCALTGYSPDEMLQLKISEVTHPDDRERDWELFQRVVRGDAPDYHLEKRYVRKDGQVVWASVNVTVIRDSAGVPLRTMAAIEDITERKRLEQERQTMESQLRQQQKLESIGTLASGVAHEINNPITGIMNYAQLIQDRLPPESPLTEFTGEIMHETQRVAVIVRNLLTFARNEKQSHSPARIADIVAGTLSLIRTVLRHDQITLTVNIPEDLPLLKCRSQQIQQVVMNLMTNARDALNERYPGHNPGKMLKLDVHLFEKEGRRWIRVTVEDHGTGIPLEVQERMFDPFFTTKPRDKGTGLGLAISHGIVRDHHGVLTVETEPGRFTRFHVDLPVDNGWEV
jgi:PAS domain S-box-containing protein